MTAKTRYTATIEFLPGQGAAIVALYDDHGEWSGAGRVEIKAPSRDALYEAGYNIASTTAASKGGTLDRFSVVP